MPLPVGSFADSSEQGPWTLICHQLSPDRVAAPKSEDWEVRRPLDECIQKQSMEVYHPNAGETTFALPAIQSVCTVRDAAGTSLLRTR